MKVTSMGRDARAAKAQVRGRRPCSVWGGGGFTLIELLAAMMVLLVGVYAVAALFPKLTRNIVDEERRTSVSRSAEQMSAAYQDGVLEAPDATAPLNAQISIVTPPDDKPEDPDSSNFTSNPPNDRDDNTVVYGEEFTVPAPAWAGGYPCYVPKMGLLDTGTAPTVVELRELKETFRDPDQGGTVRDGEYYLAWDPPVQAGDLGDGQIVFSAPSSWWRPGAAWALLYYNWYDGSVVRRSVGELVQSGDFVQAIADRGGNVLAGDTKAYARRTWSCIIGVPNAANLPNNPDVLQCVVDERAGQALYFPPYAVGRKLRIDYRVRREDLQGGVNYRRALLMHEDKVLPSTTPYEMQLSFGYIDDERALATTNHNGGALTASAWIMLVDMADGTPIAWQAATGTGFDFLRAVSNVDLARGVITIDPAVLSGRLGRPVRIYYRSLDQHSVQVYKTPSEFVETVAGVTPDVPNWEHRCYMIGAAPSGSGSYTCLYNFPAYLEDQAVQVDYIARVGGQLERITNELHVIYDLGVATRNFGFVLNKANVEGVLDVRGASMRVCGWWRTETGRVERLDMTQMLFPRI